MSLTQYEMSISLLIQAIGIVSTKRDLTHFFSRFHIFGYSRSLQCPLHIASYALKIGVSVAYWKFARFLYMEMIPIITYNCTMYSVSKERFVHCTKTKCLALTYAVHTSHYWLCLCILTLAAAALQIDLSGV